MPAIATKCCPAITVTPTARGADALACLRLAVAEASAFSDSTICVSRAGRGPRSGESLGMTPAPIAVVSDNGPCFRGEVFKTAFDGCGPMMDRVVQYR